VIGLASARILRRPAPPPAAYYYLTHTLRETLPDLLTNSPEDIARRNGSALARIASLCPVNIVEAEVTASQVAYAEHAKACLRDPKRRNFAAWGNEMPRPSRPRARPQLTR
jgi:hypothetical protein